jgi:hypothetical protein
MFASKVEPGANSDANLSLSKCKTEVIKAKYGDEQAAEPVIQLHFKVS